MLKPEDKPVPKNYEKDIYEKWLLAGCFKSVPDERPPYTILIPPPNVTGVLHMGHMLNNTIQDVLIRRARMLGFNACWVPGTDHASIATEARVVKMLKEKGIRKSDLTRDEFLQHAWEWKNRYGGIILEQLKKLGASCDWDRTRFTMDEAYYKAVIRVFVDLYRKGYIYRAKRMINWDCDARTALSNEEVIYAEGGEEAILYYVRYPLTDGSGSISIATQRPETIPADVAIAVNPKDDRYKNLIGKNVIVPLVHRSVPIITDNYVDPQFGTGCLKVTPAHDVSDYEIALRHNLPVIDILNDDGTLNNLCGVAELTGLDRFTAREKAVQILKSRDQIEKEEKVTSRIGRSERTGSVVEPRLSEQWFLRMDKLAAPALNAIINGDIQLHPEKFINTYRYWMENVRDWCISRQLWWGHRIPAWYLKADPTRFQVAESAKEALELFRLQDPEIQEQDITQDPDVLDTWASSWLWPVSVFDGFEFYDLDKRNFTEAPEDLKYYYPTSVLVTAPEILFFWVARMIMIGYEYMGKPPFKDVYLTGIVRDKQGRKMSKSLGNSPEPLELMDHYGADGVRLGMLLCSPAGNDLLFDESLCLQGRNFCNKLWNAFRLITIWEVDPDASQMPHAHEAIKWFSQKLSESIEHLNQQFHQFRLNDALMTVYKLIWDDFCSIYLEAIKPSGSRQDPKTLETTWVFMEKLLRLAHPFIPFISEKLYEFLPAKYRTSSSFLMLAPWPSAERYDTSYLKQFNDMLGLVASIRQFRNNQKIPFKEKITVYGPDDLTAKDVLIKLCNVGEWKKYEEKGAQATAIVHSTIKIFAEAEKSVSSLNYEKLREELQYVKGFLAAVEKKLANEKFITHARPELVEHERRKKADAEKRIHLLEELISTEKKNNLT